MVYTLRTNTTSSFLNTSCEEKQISPKSRNSVYLSDKQWEYLEKQSEELETNTSRLLRHIIKQHIAEHGLQKKENFQGELK